MREAMSMKSNYIYVRINTILIILHVVLAFKVAVSRSDSLKSANQLPVQNLQNSNQISARPPFCQAV